MTFSGAGAYVALGKKKLTDWGEILLSDNGSAL